VATSHGAVLGSRAGTSPSRAIDRPIDCRMAARYGEERARIPEEDLGGPCVPGYYLSPALKASSSLFSIRASPACDAAWMQAFCSQFAPGPLQRTRPRFRLTKRSSLITFASGYEWKVISSCAAVRGIQSGTTLRANMSETLLVA